jgi:hypothetical protein
MPVKKLPTPPSAMTDLTASPALMPRVIIRAEVV